MADRYGDATGLALAALTVIGGLVVSTMLTLLIVPAVYALLDRRR